MTHPRPPRGLFVSLAALALLASPAYAGGQNPSTPSPSASSSSASQGPSPAPDFLIGRPKGTLGVRGSWFMASTGSDFYDTVIHELTLEKSSFRTATFTAEGGFSITPQLEITGSVDMNRVSRNSEDRDEEELLSNGTRVPIKQSTGLSEKNFMASAKFSLVPRGRTVSKLAWIPRTFVPYIGAGAGVGSYNLRQNGDFVDFVDHHIFTDTFRSEGWAPVYQVFGGSDIQLYRRLIISVDARYTWERGDLGTDFLDFDPIDLGGLRIGAGIHFAF